MKKLTKQILEYLDYCEKIKKLSALTLKNRRSFLLRFARSVPARNLSGLTNEMVENWFKNQTWTGSTANVYLVEIKTLVKFFRKKGVRTRRLTPENFPHIKETPKRRIYYTSEQISEVLKTCDELEWLLIRLSYECGLRIHELVNLRLKNFDGQKITFVGKGRKLREVYMSREARSRLDEWMVNQKVCDKLWVRRGAEISRKQIDLSMRRAFERAGYKNFYPHSLRHSFATAICLRGASLEVAKEMLGHANINTTVRYVHSLEGRLEEFFEAYRFC